MTRIMVALCDTEGAPHRGGGDSSLWDFCAIMHYVVDGDTFELLEECYHTFQFSMPKHLTRHVVKHSITSHFHAMDHIRQKYNCDGICFCFWNAGHDLSVLNYYDLGTITTVDLLAVARAHTKNTHESYSIENLCKEFDIKCNVKLHSALGDVIRLGELLPYLGINDTTIYNTSVEKKKSTRKTTHEQKPNDEKKNQPPTSTNVSCKKIKNRNSRRKNSIVKARNSKITK